MTWQRNRHGPSVSVHALCLDLDENARRNHQSVECLYGSSRRLEDIDEAPMRAHFELFPRFLVYVWAAKHGVTLDPGGERNRTSHPCASSLGLFHNLNRRCIERSMIVGLHPNSNSIQRHVRSSSSQYWGPPTRVMAKSGYATVSILVVNPVYRGFWGGEGS